MSRQRVTRWIVGGALGAAVLSGGAVAAYPPNDTTVTTVTSSSRSAIRQPTDSSELAATGSDSGDTLKIAGGAVLAGAGLLVVARARRRPSVA